MNRLPPRLGPRPRILFVGINPGLRSGALGHHFAGPGNPFWRLLHAAGLVPEPLTYADDVRLPAFGLGITNLVERATRGADELARVEFAAGRRRLDATIARARPRVARRDHGLQGNGARRRGRRGRRARLPDRARARRRAHRGPLRRRRA